jgi:predicted porin
VPSPRLRKHMKKQTQIFSAIIVPLMLTGLASAQQQTMTAPDSAQEVHTYFGFSAAYGEGTVDFTNASGSEVTADLGGIRLDGGILFGPGFSLNGRYQYLQDDGDGDINEFRAILNYKHTIAEGFAAFAGVGYGAQMIDITQGFEIDQQAILGNIGFEFQACAIFGSLSYTHGFTTSAEVDAFGSSADANKDDTGNIELMLGYEFDPHFALIFTAKAEVLQQALYREDWLTTLGVRYSF